MATGSCVRMHAKSLDSTVRSGRPTARERDTEMPWMVSLRGSALVSGGSDTMSYRMGPWDDAAASSWDDGHTTS